MTELLPKHDALCKLTAIVTDSVVPVLRCDWVILPNSVYAGQHVFSQETEESMEKAGRPRIGDKFIIAISRGKLLTSDIPPLGDDVPVTEPVTTEDINIAKIKTRYSE